MTKDLPLDLPHVNPFKLYPDCHSENRSSRAAHEVIWKKHKLQRAESDAS